MTAIVGIKHNDSVFIGADSRITDGWLRYSDHYNQKVWVDEGWGFAIAGSLRGGQLLKSFHAPRRFVDEDLMEYLSGRWVYALMKHMEAHKFLSSDEGEASMSLGAIFSTEKRLFKIFRDFSVIEYDEVAGGSGEEYAIGSLNATRNKNKPDVRMRKALEAASANSAGVGGEIVIKEIK